MSAIDGIIREDARLIILRALTAEVDGRLNSELLREVLESYGISRSRDWVHAEIRHLADVGAVQVTEAGSVLVAAITRRGLDHVERRVIIDAVKRPSPPGV